MRNLETTELELLVTKHRFLINDRVLCKLIVKKYLVFKLRNNLQSTTISLAKILHSFFKYLQRNSLSFLFITRQFWRFILIKKFRYNPIKYPSKKLQNQVIAVKIFFNKVALIDQLCNEEMKRVLKYKKIKCSLLLMIL